MKNYTKCVVVFLRISLCLLLSPFYIKLLLSSYEKMNKYTKNTNEGRRHLERSDTIIVLLER